MKKVFVLLFFIFVMACPCLAKQHSGVVGEMTTSFSLDDMPETITFQTQKEVRFSDDIIIPEKSLITAKVLKAQRQLRWHKSGVILCRITNFLPIFEEKAIDLSKEEIFVAVRKYEKVYVKEATIIGTEIVLSQGASFFAPGVDILYFFTKGAILKTTHPHWFMAGVSNAYENSICWFWLKGKPIELDVDDKVKAEELSLEKYEKMSAKIEKRQKKDAQKQEKKELKQQKEELKKQKKLEKELEKQRLLQP